MDYAKQTIVDFLSGNLDIIEFRNLYDEKPEINAFCYPTHCKHGK